MAFAARIGTSILTPEEAPGSRASQKPFKNLFLVKILASSPARDFLMP